MADQRRNRPRVRNGNVSFEWVDLEFTEHAVHAMAQRRILSEWVERAVQEPMLRVPDPNDFEIERFFCKVPE